MYTAAARLGCQLILCRLPDTGAARLSGMAMVGWAEVGVVEGVGRGEGGGRVQAPPTTAVVQPAAVVNSQCVVGMFFDSPYKN